MVKGLSELAYRCAVCKEPFKVRMNEHQQLVDVKDDERPVKNQAGDYVHSSCQQGHPEAS